MLSVVQFLRYARAFEKTLRDDKWDRISPYFADDAVYEVDDAVYGCRLEGREAIFAGLKKSLDGFDRRFPKRSIKLTERPRLGWNRVGVSWSVRYKHHEWEPFTLVGKSDARFRRGRIVLLRDELKPGMHDEVAAWSEQHGVELEPGYV